MSGAKIGIIQILGEIEYLKIKAVKDWNKINKKFGISGEVARLEPSKIVYSRKES